MNWDISFLFQNNVVVVSAAVCIFVFLGINKAIPKQVRNYFYLLITVALIEGAETYIDHVLSLVVDNRYELLRILVSNIGYSTRPIMLYIVLLIMLRNSKAKHKKALLFLPSFVTMVVSFMAFFTPKVYYYDPNNIFHGGPLRNVFIVVLLFYDVMILIINTTIIKKDLKESVVLTGVIIALLCDLLLSLFVSDAVVHGQIIGFSIFVYFVYFLTVFHNEKVEEINESFSKTEKQMAEHMLNQSIETLAYTIDVKDRYTRGHSLRVANYARKIARLAELDEEKCRKIYLSGLLHDIGKIAIHDEVINKEGPLTHEEYEHIQLHPEKGVMILEKMSDFPFLQDGALYHHERYDGKGYPKGLKGDEIPEMARIIAVADAYDAMTSHRSYRNALDQADTKQEIWKGMGTQFDPYYAKMMISLIDADIDYEMREKEDHKDEIIFEATEQEFVWEAYVPADIKSDNQIMMETMVLTLGEFAFRVNNWENPSDSMHIGSESSAVQFQANMKEDAGYLWFVPTAIIFSSDDGKVAGENYDELGVFVSAGYSWRAGSAISETSAMCKLDGFGDWDQWIQRNKEGMTYTFSAVREEEKVIIKMECELLCVDAQLILPENYDREIYMTVTGEKCKIANIEFV